MNPIASRPTSPSRLFRLRPRAASARAAHAPEPSLFDTAAAELLVMLREQLGFATWVVGRIRGADWTADCVEGTTLPLRQGDAFSWTESLCSRMAAGLGPRYAPDLREIPQYASAPFAAAFGIRAYAGVPLLSADGRLLGSVCAFDTAPQPAFSPARLQMIETCARLLGHAMHADQCTARLSRRLERAESIAFCDSLTQLYNRRGWDQLLQAEESRCRRHGRTACVVSIDLDDLKAINDAQGHEKGDELLQRAAKALRATLRTQDVAARVGGDEFAVLAVECEGDAVIALHERLTAGLDAEGISASIGVAMRSATQDLAHTWRQADEAMYVAKRARKASRKTPALT